MATPIINLDNRERRELGQKMLNDMINEDVYSDDEILCMVDIIMNEEDYSIEDLKKIAEEGM